MNGCNHWRGHAWAKWSEPEEYTNHLTPIGAVGLKQERRCLRCNMMQVYTVTRLFEAS